MNLSKILSSAFAVAVLSASAFAGDVTLSINNAAYLSSCGGTVEVTKSAQGNNGEQVNLVFAAVKDCSVFDIVSNDGSSLDYDAKKIQGAQGNRSGSFTLPKRVLDRGFNNVKIIVRSDSGKHADTVRVQFYVETPRREQPRREEPRYEEPSRPVNTGMHSSQYLTIGEESRLLACGGMVTVTKSAQGNEGGEQVNLTFRGVEKCSNFDILKTNGESIDYDSKKLQGNDGNRSGGFTLPKRVLDLGWNNVKVVVKSNSGQTSDTITVQVRVVPVEQPMPTPPTSNGGGGIW